MSNQEIQVSEWLSDRWEKLKNRVKGHFEEYDFSRTAVAHNVSLLLILIIAATIRLFPLLKGWDPQIKAFDPWMQIRASHYILDHGFWNYLLWYDDLSWYPRGRVIGKSLYIGVPVAVVLTYKLLTLLGFSVTVEFAGYLMPVFMGTLCVYYSYLLGKELISTRGGLISALVMAVTPAYVSRSIAGFVDNESVGVTFTVMTFYYFIRAMSRDSNKDAILAGISLALLGSSWGAFRFALDLLPLYAMVLIVTGNYSTRFLRIYTTTVSISLLWMILIPRDGGLLILSTEGIAPLGMIGFMVLFGWLRDLSNNLSPEQFRRFLVSSFILLLLFLGGTFVILIAFGGVSLVGSKFISVILPNVRNKLPLIDSVSEHLPLAWGNLYSNLSTLVFFIPMGLYFAIKKSNEKNLFIITFGMSTIYFSGSMVRLMLILAPSAAILTALAVDNLLIPYAYTTHGRIKLTKTTMSMPSIGGQNAAGSYLTVFALLIIALSAGITTAATSFTVPEITPGGTQQTALTDWLDAFDWMRSNTNYAPYSAQENYVGLQNNAPIPTIVSWWDYGNYITSPGKSISLVDNATHNSTQIGVVGTMLMWNATFAINLMYQYGVQYVLVVPAGGNLNLGSDIGKSIWMIRIAEQYTPQFQVHEKDYFDKATGYKGAYFDSVLWRLMAYQSPDMQGASNASPPPFIQDSSLTGLLGKDFRNYVPTSLQYFHEVFRSTGLAPSNPGAYPVIRIFKVDYPADIQLRVNEFNLHMAQLKAENSN